MERLLDFLEKHRWGILATFLLHILFLLYLQIDTYKYELPGRGIEVLAEVVEEEFIELNPEMIVAPESQQTFHEEVKNLTQNASDKREKSLENFSRASTDQKVQQNVKDLERQLFEEFSSKHGNSNGEGVGKTSAGSTSDKTNESKPPKEYNSTTSTSGTSNSENQYAGKTMVRFELENRFPHNNNDWHIRNPGYTCGGNANGLVVVAIRVNPNGDVLSSKYVPELSNNASSCMIEQAESYARKSRFAFNSSAPKMQDGYIFYQFVSKK